MIYQVIYYFFNWNVDLRTKELRTKVALKIQMRLKYRLKEYE